MKRTIKAMLQDLVAVLKNNVKDLFLLLYFIVSLLAIIFCTDSLRIKWIVAICCSFIAVYLSMKYVDYFRRLERKDQKPRERYTKKLSNGDVTIDESRLHQAIVYLSILEDKDEEM